MLNTVSGPSPCQLFPSLANVGQWDMWFRNYLKLIKTSVMTCTVFHIIMSKSVHNTQYAICSH